jgi:SET family sugar efflux transporter-like MFS transporter
MLVSDRYSLLRAPGFAVAAFSMLLAVTAQAMAASYMSRLAAEHARMSPLELGVSLTLSGISGIGVTSVLARIFDSGRRQWPLALSLALGFLGYGLCAVTADRWTLMIVAFLFLGPATASFALIYAIAKSSLDQRAASLAARGMAALRMIASLSWVFGPAMGAFLIHKWSYAGVYGAAAGCCICALLTVRGLKPANISSVAATTPARTVTLKRTVKYAVLALTVFNVAMFMVPLHFQSLSLTILVAASGM